MRIRLSKKIGFCFGVKRAVGMAEKALDKNKSSIYSLGSIIHNSQVVERLSRKGLKVIKDAGRMKGGVVVISSHGLSPGITKRILRRGIKIIDTTCPFVLNAQRIARRLGEEGYDVVVVGDAAHPEIKALVDFIPKGRGSRIYVVKDKHAAVRLKLGHDQKVGVISQTTQSSGNFLDVVKVISEKRPRELRVFNTICKDAEERQNFAGRLAKNVGMMLIIGGKNSANTRRLFEVCRKVLADSHLIETDKDLKENWFKKRQVIGVTSGASTPDWVIRKVVNSITRSLKQKAA